MKYRVYASVVGGRYLGEVEADSQEEAEDKGQALMGEADCRLCHQCSRQIDDPEFEDLIVEAEDDQ